MIAIAARPHGNFVTAMPLEQGIDSDVHFGPREVLNFDAGREIYAQGERANALFRIELGVVRIYRLLADGRRPISTFCFAGEVFGFEPREEHHFFAEAVGTVVVKVFRNPLDAEVSAALFQETVKALVRAQEHLLVIGRQSAIERVAGFLLAVKERQNGGTRIELPITRADIGDYLGLTTETVSRCIGKLKGQGLIHLLGSRSLEILDAEALLDLCP